VQLCKFVNERGNFATLRGSDRPKTGAAKSPGPKEVPDRTGCVFEGRTCAARLKGPGFARRVVGSLPLVATDETACVHCLIRHPILDCKSQRCARVRRPRSPGAPSPARPRSASGQRLENGGFGIPECRSNTMRGHESSPPRPPPPVKLSVLAGAPNVRRGALPEFGASNKPGAAVISLSKLPQHVGPVGGCVHDRDTNAAINLELVGRATPEPAQMPTCGEMEALAVEQSATKLPWMNRKRDRRTHVRTN